MARRDFETLRDKFARDDGLPFGHLLKREYVLNVLEAEGHAYRNRVFCPLVTLWAWLSQCLSQDKSLNEAVSRILAHRVSIGLPPCSASSAGYTRARIRFPGNAMTRMAKEIGRNVHDSADRSWKWRGREVFLADGTGFTMPDTPENQLAWPQSNRAPTGVGFPIIRAVVLISLATGAVINMAFARYKGKGTGEINLLQSMLGSLSPGNIVVADRYYPSFATVAMLQGVGVDLVSVSHHTRKIDFSTGQILGPKDHIVEWPRPQSRRYIDPKVHASLPISVMVREFAIEIEDRDGGKREAVVISTIVDPSVPKDELAELYWQRWNCELDIRSIKHSLNMDVLRCKTPAMIRKEIWCHLLAYNLLRGTMVESAKRSNILPRQLSVKGTMQAVESFTPAMMAAPENKNIFDALLMTVSAHRVKNRPGREEPRFKKRRPGWTTYMTVPRHKSKRRLNGSAREAARRTSKLGPHKKSLFEAKLTTPSA
jgi:Transposase DDE domain